MSDGEQPIKEKMEQYHKNPRVISAKELEELKANIEKLGDLSGITHDLTTDEIITGNQRSKIINVNDCQKEIIEQYEQPNAQGTVAWGYIIWDGQRLNYRQVRWNEEQRKQACISANKMGGKFDYQILEDRFDTAELVEWGFKEEELGQYDVLGDLLEADTFSNHMKTTRDEFAMTFLIPKEFKFDAELYLRKHGKKGLSEAIINFIKSEQK